MMTRTTSTRALVAAARDAGAALAIMVLGVVGYGAGCHSGSDPQDVSHGVSGAKACAMSCSVPADCTSPDAPPAFDASHFACTAGACAYTGCKNDQECTAMNGQGWACRAMGGFPSCVLTCTTAADCSSSDAPPAFDASHFACTGGLCEYTGCKNNQECTSMYGQGWACRTVEGAAHPSCVKTCSAPADCAVPNAPPMYSASHFACTAGVCEHLGCKSDQECVTAVGEGAVCR